MPKKKKWIPSNLKEGSFTKQARAAGMGVQDFANKVLANPENYSDTTRKRASLAKTFNEMSHKKKKKR